ncbi:hypothetical protein CC86DRAFT_386886 [Ophiobolus disseminans]|uniref:Uncharacterized protein n=1 Tax=Ophiobolus disseminans TaxID=1469910 RepID=A0A6A6ZIY2_9PLEO|nr:hypothetical protein CC86DRAFT_386886 [Ophiobolus disseminans]
MHGTNAARGQDTRRLAGSCCARKRHIVETASIHNGVYGSFFAQGVCAFPIGASKATELGMMARTCCGHIVYMAACLQEEHEIFRSVLRQRWIVETRGVPAELAQVTVMKRHTAQQPLRRARRGRQRPFALQVPQSVEEHDGGRLGQLGETEPMDGVYIGGKTGEVWVRCSMHRWWRVYIQVMKKKRP